MWALVGIIGVLVTGGIYLTWGGFAEQGEINFSSVAWLLYQGQPLYTDIDAAERYSIQHGPIAYLVIGGVMKIFGPGYITAKLSGVSAFILVVLVSWIWFSQLVSKKEALYLLGLEIWILFHWPHSFFSRPDSLMLLCVVISMYICTTKSNTLLLVLGIAIPMGLMVNLKIHGAIYFLPVMVVVFRRLGFGHILLIGALTMLLAIAPYLLPQISFANYLVWLNTSVELGAKNCGFVLKNFVPKVFFAISLSLIPILLGIIYGINLYEFFKRNKYLILTTLFSLVIAAIIAAKPGSGTNHLMPFIPVLCYIIILFISDIRNRVKDLPEVNRSNFVVKLSYATLAVCIILFTIGGLGRQKALIQPILESDRTATLQELYSIQTLYKGKTLQVGYGKYESYADFRDFVPVPVFHGNPLLVESVALGDMKAIGLQMPQATLKKLEEGAIQVWLIPRGDMPFSLGTFDESFQQAFLHNYILASRMKFFDIWVYKQISS